LSINKQVFKIEDEEEENPENKSKSDGKSVIVEALEFEGLHLN
jgi:hypothetical protein